MDEYEQNDRILGVANYMCLVPGIRARLRLLIYEVAELGRIAVS